MSKHQNQQELAIIIDRVVATGSDSKTNSPTNQQKLHNLQFINMQDQSFELNTLKTGTLPTPYERDSKDAKDLKESVKLNVESTLLNKD